MKGELEAAFLDAGLPRVEDVYKRQAQHPAHHQVGAERRIEQGNGREDDKGRDDRG